MIDIESRVITAVKEAVNEQYEGVNFTSEYTPVIEEFPTVYIYESNNATYDASLTEDCIEHHATVSYTIEVYTNKSAGKKSLAKGIMNAADVAMLKMKFSRSSTNIVPNIDSSICRIVNRYVAIVGESVTDSSGNVINKMYRP